MDIAQPISKSLPLSKGLRNYLLFSSVFAIFTEAFLVKYIIDWKLLYLIIILNYFILLRIKKLQFNKYFIGLLFFFLVHGALSYTIIGIPYNFMLSQILGIAVVGTYYYNFLPLYTKKEVISVYARLCFWVAAIGYVLYFMNRHDEKYRLMSIFTEPAHYVIVIIPACYYYFKNKKYFEFAVIFGTLVISNSSLGYVGCALMFIVPNLTLRRLGYLVLLIPFVVIIFNYVYNNYDFFKMRIDDTYNSLNVINTGKFHPDTNLSSYVMIGNIFIMKNNVTDHPLGSGIGSHHWMHTQRYLKEMRPPEYLVIQSRHTDNSFDANSLFTRIASEFGLIGVLLVIWVLAKGSRVFSTTDYVSQGIFVYFLLKLFRDGHYFPPEFYFFIWLFFYSYKLGFQPVLEEGEKKPLIT